jgi:hypothetical protein
MGSASRHILLGLRVLAQKRRRAYQPWTVVRSRLKPSVHLQLSNPQSRLARPSSHPVGEGPVWTGPRGRQNGLTAKNQLTHLRSCKTIPAALVTGQIVDRRGCFQTFYASLFDIKYFRQFVYPFMFSMRRVSSIQGASSYDPRK